MGRTIFRQSRYVHLRLPAIFVVVMAGWVFVAGERLPILFFLLTLVVIPGGIWFFSRNLVADLEWDGTTLSGHRFSWLSTGASFEMRADTTTHWRVVRSKGQLAGIEFKHESGTYMLGVRAGTIVDFSAIRALAPNLEGQLGGQKNVGVPETVPVRKRA